MIMFKKQQLARYIIGSACFVAGSITLIRTFYREGIVVGAKEMYHLSKLSDSELLKKQEEE